jgi:hypothetical protein
MQIIQIDLKDMNFIYLFQNRLDPESDLIFKHYAIIFVVLLFAGIFF